ncbi:MAG: hypothetical protein M1840_006356 [Geoglossum simile]|nr:MAG: hypothetical protein M1840_006356 [Geoglossum simile]
MSTGYRDGILDDVKQKGYFCRLDGGVGTQVKEVISSREGFWTAKILSVCNTCVDEDISMVIKALLGSLTLVDGASLGASDNINCVLPKVRIVKLGHEGMLILLLSPGSEVELYAGSHHIEHRDDEPRFNWGGYQASKERLGTKSPDNMKMPEGGLYVSQLVEAL